MAGIRVQQEENEQQTRVAGDLFSDDDKSVAADSWSIKSDYGSTLDEEQRHVDAADILTSVNNRSQSDYSSDKEESEGDGLTSLLGLQSYWDATYAEDLANFREHGLSGEIWFGEDVMEILVSWTKNICTSVSMGHIPSSENDIKPREKAERDIFSWSVLDIGTGNGILLHQFAKKGFSDLTGVDYSEGAIDLARSLAARDKYSTIKFLVDDILETKLEEQYLLVIDKGTFDAIGLHPNGPIKIRRYWEAVSELVAPGGVLVVTSCNNTKDELVQQMENFNNRCLKPQDDKDSQKDTGSGVHPFVYLDHIRTYPAFMFGGVTGSPIATVAFRRN